MSTRIYTPAHRGAGLYGREPKDKKHHCGRCNNGTGIYNPACPGNRPSQTVPYDEEPMDIDALIDDYRAADIAAREAEMDRQMGWEI